MVAVGGPGWQLAGCLVRLFDDADRYAPRRSRISDGTIGDVAHQARRSDHNPDSNRFVCAADLTHDPVGGFDAWQVAQTIAQNVHAGIETRVVYLISGDPAVLGDQIFHRVAGVWQWNAHPHTNGSHRNHHLHVSCTHDQPGRDDQARWQLSTPIPTKQKRRRTMDLIRTITAGPAVTDWQTKRLLGPKTLAAFQDAQVASTGVTAPVVTVSQDVFDSIPNK